MKTPLNPILALGITSMVSFSAIQSVQAQLFDFNTPGQLAAEFRPGSQGGVGTQTTSGGLSNSGWVSNTIAAGGRGFEIAEQSFAATTSPITLSIYFQWQTNVTTGGEGLQLGIGRSTNPAVEFSPVGGNAGAIGPASTQALSVGIGPRTNANDVRIYVSSMVNGTNSNTNQPGSPVATLTSGNWYYLETEFTQLGTGDGFSYDVALFNSSNTGVVSGGSLLAYSASITNANLTSGSLNAYFGTRNPDAVGITGVDNFSVSAIPEPSVVGMLGAALCLMFALLRSRKARS